MLIQMLFSAENFAHLKPAVPPAPSLRRPGAIRRVLGPEKAPKYTLGAEAVFPMKVTAADRADCKL
jgi:hypothetical protein